MPPRSAALAVIVAAPALDAGVVPGAGVGATRRDLGGVTWLDPKLADPRTLGKAGPPAQGRPCPPAEVISAAPTHHSQHLAVLNAQNLSQAQQGIEVWCPFSFEDLVESGFGNS